MEISVSRIWKQNNHRAYICFCIFKKSHFPPSLVYLLFKLCWWSIILDFQLSFFTVNRIILSWQHVCEFFIIFLIIISINVVFRIRNFFSDRVTNICVIVSSYFSNRLISRFSFYSLPGRLLLMLLRFLG